MASYVSKFIISLPPGINMIGRLDSIKKSGLSKDTSFKLICPECETPTKVNQGYTCTNGHGPFASGDCAKAKEVAKNTLARVSAEEIEEAGKGEFQPDVLELTVHRAEDVEANTYAAENAYVFYPEVGIKGQYGMFVDLIEKHPELAFIGFSNIRHKDYLVRLTVWDGRLVVQILRTPDELAARETVDRAYKEQLLPVAEQLCAGMVEDFDPNVYRNRRRERFAAIGGDTPVEIAVPDRAPVKDSDEAALEAMLAELERRKGA